MIRILFIRPETATLPEIEAYVQYFNSHDNFKAVDSGQLDSYELGEYDIVWEFKGFGGVKVSSNQLLIHEYASLSTGKLPRLKNLIKSFKNKTPDIRIYLNRNVEKGFHFLRKSPVIYRDMGVSDKFVGLSGLEEKEYEYIYVGEVSKSRGMDDFLEWFTVNINESLCLVGSYDESIYEIYKDNTNISFLGKIPYEDVPKTLLKARKGVNYMPDVYPYNIQTSTKLIEYLTVGLDIVSTDYQWVQEFSKSESINYGVIDLGGDSIKYKNNGIQNTFDSKNYLWHSIIDNSGIKNLIENLVNK